MMRDPYVLEDNHGSHKPVKRVYARGDESRSTSAEGKLGESLTALPVSRFLLRSLP